MPLQRRHGLSLHAPLACLRPVLSTRMSIRYTRTHLVVVANMRGRPFIYGRPMRIPLLNSSSIEFLLHARFRFVTRGGERILGED
jgi:hypothetical protein